MSLCRYVNQTVSLKNEPIPALWTCSIRNSWRGKGSGFDSDGCAVLSVSLVALAVRVVVDMVGQADCPVVLSPRLVDVVLSDDFLEMLWLEMGLWHRGRKQGEFR